MIIVKLCLNELSASHKAFVQVMGTLLRGGTDLTLSLQTLLTWYKPSMISD